MYGMTKDQLSRAPRLATAARATSCQCLNDHEGTLEMGATIMRNGIAGADIDRMTDPTNPLMFQANRNAGEEIRSVLLGHGIVPEDMPKEPHLSGGRTHRGWSDSIRTHATHATGKRRQRQHRGMLDDRTNMVTSARNIHSEAPHAHKLTAFVLLSLAFEVVATRTNNTALGFIRAFWLAGRDSYTWRPAVHAW